MFNVQTWLTIFALDLIGNIKKIQCVGIKDSGPDGEKIIGLPLAIKRKILSLSLGYSSYLISDCSCSLHCSSSFLSLFTAFQIHLQLCLWQIRVVLLIKKMARTKK